MQVISVILNCHIISHKSRQLSYQVRPEKRRNYEEERDKESQRNMYTLGYESKEEEERFK